MANRLNGKTAAITGGSQGIGLTIAQRFAEEGADISFCYRSNKAGAMIINISSLHEELPFPHFASYCASKGGVKMLTRNLSIELAPLGITINSIAPGAIETPINKNLLNDPAKLRALLENIPLKRLGTPDDVANMAVFLASQESNYATGTTFFVDGGLTSNYQEQ